MRRRLVARTADTTDTTILSQMLPVAFVPITLPPKNVRPTPQGLGDVKRALKDLRARLSAIQASDSAYIDPETGGKPTKRDSTLGFASLRKTGGDPSGGGGGAGRTSSQSATQELIDAAVRAYNINPVTGVAYMYHRKVCSNPVSTAAFLYRYRGALNTRMTMRFLAQGGHATATVSNWERSSASTRVGTTYRRASLEAAAWRSRA